MATPSIPESHLDLLELPVATLATNGPDGRPQVTVIWFLVEDGTIKISLNTDRKKYANLVADPRATIVFLDTTSPFRYLELRCDVGIEADPDYTFADKVGAKYGTDVRGFDGDHLERAVLILTPVRVNAV